MNQLEQTNKAWKFYPGCTLMGTAADYYQSARCVFDKLGHPIKELDDWVCCGSTAAHTTDRNLSIALPAYSLSLAQKQNVDLGFACAACFNRFRHANHALRNEPGLLEKINRAINIDYDGSVEVYHLLQILRNRIGLNSLSKTVINNISNLRVVAYYGCLLVRPPEITQFDDPENPTIMDEVLTAVGADVVPWGMKVDCCGAGLNLARKDLVAALVEDIVIEAERAKADVIAVSCPECHANLDMRQIEARRLFGRKKMIPILYFSQLIGLAFDIPPNKLGINKPLHSAKPILVEKGIL